MKSPTIKILFSSQKELDKGGIGQHRIRYVAV